MKYLSVCAVFKQETPFLKEWLDYHLSMGVEYFYLCCNDYEDAVAKEVLLPYMDKITYTHCFEKAVQPKHYLNTLTQHRNDSRWIAFLDLDEFILPIEKNIPDNLQEYEQYGGLVLNMICFGASGLKTGPTSQIQELIYRLPDYCGMPGHTYIKSIVNPKVTIKHQNDQPHGCLYEKGYFAVNTRHEIVYGHKTNPEVSNKMRINHYYTRSEEWWKNVKMKRGRADVLSTETYAWDVFLTVEENSTILDTTIRNKYLNNSC